MIFECEGKPAIKDPKKVQILKVIRALKSYGPTSYASITDEKSGDYLQVAGGGVTCMLEMYRANSNARVRAFHEKANSVFPDGTLLIFGAGRIEMKSDEWFTSDKVAEMFCAFIEGAELPKDVHWRPAPGF